MNECRQKQYSDKNVTEVHDDEEEMTNQDKRLLIYCINERSLYVVARPSQWRFSGEGALCHAPSPRRMKKIRINSYVFLMTMLAISRLHKHGRRSRGTGGHVPQNLE